MPGTSLGVAAANGAVLHSEIIDLTPPWLIDPPTIVMSHGVATDCEIWNGWLPHLVAHARIVRFDSRGFGRSPMPAGEGWKLETWAADILAVADVAGADRFHLLAESAAGAAALHVASGASASRVLSVATCSAPYRGSDLPRVADWRQRLEREGMAAWAARMMTERFHEGALSPGAADWFAVRQAAADPAVLANVAEGLMGVDLSDALPRIAVPALIMAADGSPYVTVEIARAMQRLIPDAELRIVPHSRHGIPFSHADACAADYLAFLRRRGGFGS